MYMLFINSFKINNRNQGSAILLDFTVFHFIVGYSAFDLLQTLDAYSIYSLRFHNGLF